MAISPHEWLMPWRAIAQGEGTAFEAELARELSPGHPLVGHHAMAVGRRDDCDDVLFALFGKDQSLAVVHLTWSCQAETAPHWPTTQFFTSWEEWAQTGMLADHSAFE